jgi:hypothetical protein
MFAFHRSAIVVIRLRVLRDKKSFLLEAATPLLLREGAAVVS